MLDEAELHIGHGVVAGSWIVRGRGPNPKAQVTLMNAHATALVAGDQLYVDLDLSRGDGVRKLSWSSASA